MTTTPAVRELRSRAGSPLPAVFAAIVVAAAFAALPGPVAAASEELATVRVDEDAIRFEPAVRAGRWELRVTGTDGVVLRRRIEGTDADGLAIPRRGEAALPPGHYTYALYASVPGEVSRRVQAGAFVLDEGGVHLASAENAPELHLAARVGPGLGVTAAPAAAFDTVFNDDIVGLRSACIGFDCTNGVDFSDTTIGLVENNLRITFHDTSSAASFPRNDWRLEANSSANSGSNHFAIVDCGTNGSLSTCPLNRRPFLVEAGAPSNALRVDSGGRVGMSTNNPVTEIHTRSSDTPTLRLEQGGGGFGPQTWDVAGNEANFFVRDVSNGSTLPFRIRPGAPSNMILIDDDGVAMGKVTPTAQLDVRSGNAARVGLNVDTAAAPSTPAATISFTGTPHIEFFADGLRAQAMRVLAFDNGTDVGNLIEIRRNNSATPAAASMVLSASTGMRFAIWVDNTGTVRVDNRIGVNNAADTAGTVVGTQASWFELKDEISRWSGAGALQSVRELPLYAFRFQRDSQRGDKLNHGLVVFERDRDAWWVMNAAADQTPVLDEANLFGHLIGAIHELDAEVQAQRITIAALEGRIGALEAALLRLEEGRR